MKTTPPLAAANPPEAEKKSINPELWQACAGPLVNLPVAGTHVVYFPQGHSEQVAASMKKDVDAQIPNYPNLPSKLICYLHNVTLHADPETDEVYAQMTLQPVPSVDKEALLRSDLSMKVSKPQTDFFCKTLTASDTSTHGGFSVPRRAADKIFPPLDYSMQPPAQELVARDLHDNVWSFRHIYRGQPKRHLLTTGWSLFVSGKRLFAGDSVLFIRDEKQQLLLGIRRANRQPANLSSSVLSSDSMHIGILAAAAHAAANNSPFTVFYNPRASPSEFVIPLAKYYKAVYGNQVSLGMRFRMMFETEESGTRRYMGTITGITDLDPVRWKGSQWRNLQVGWDESTGGERRSRVSVWDIEPVIAPFFICPPHPTPPQFFRPKRPRQPGMPDDDEVDGFFKRTMMPWAGCDDFGMKEPQGLPGLSLAQWMNMQSNTPSLAAPPPPPTMHHHPNNYLPSSSLPGSVLQSLAAATLPPQNCLQFNTSQPPAVMNQLGSSIMQQPHQQQLSDACQQQPRQSLISQALQTNHVQAQFLQAQSMAQSQSSLQTIQQNHRNLPPQQLQSFVPSHLTNPITQQIHLPDNNNNNNNNNNTQLQFQLLQKIQQQQQQQSQPSKIQDVLQSVSVSLPQSHATINNNQTNLMFSQQPQLPKLLPQQQQQPVLAELPGPVGHANVVFATGSSPGQGGGGQSIITDDVPSCSTSPSTNNCPSGAQNGRAVQRSTTVGDDMMQSSSILLSSSGGLETALSGGSSLAIKELQHKSENRNSNNGNSNPLMMISKSSQQNQGFLTPPQVYLNNSGSAAQMDYLDSSSSATSICLSQNDAPLQQCTNPTMSFGSQPMFFRDLSQDGGEEAAQCGGGSGERNTISFTTHIDDSHLEIPTIPKFESTHHPKEAHPAAELSSSMVSQSFGVADMGGFASLDSAIDDGSFMNGGPNWAQQPLMPRMRTYTKVYKRGAVGRSIDITRYSGYDELKQDLARRFGIEGQLEDRQRVGWKLVYVDHENDVLLVGDDPWEEFVNCVRCIKILSPQEVQQMSLDGDFGNNVLQNQTCSSSDGGNV